MVIWYDNPTNIFPFQWFNNIANVESFKYYIKNKECIQRLENRKRKIYLQWNVLFYEFESKYIMTICFYIEIWDKISRCTMRISQWIIEWMNAFNEWYSLNKKILVNYNCTPKNNNFFNSYICYSEKLF